MRLFAMAVAVQLTASVCLAQEQAPGPQQPSVEPRMQAPETGTTQKPELTIAAGTQVPLTLTNPIRTRLARRGDAVRAVTAFPVTVDTQLAIPAGTYVVGTIDKVTKRGPSGHAGLQMHFTRMLFANGYGVPLDGATAEAKAGSPGASAPDAVVATAEHGATVNGQAFQQPPQTPGLPPPPMPGPRIGTVVGIGAGVAAAGVVAAVLLAHHRGGDAFFDVGTQFDLVLESPLSLDADRVAAAIAGPAAQ